MAGINHLVLGRTTIRASVLANTSRSARGLLQCRSQLIVVSIRISRNHSGLLQYCVADGALHTTGRAGSRAGCRNFFHRFRRMAGGRSQVAQIGALNDFTTNRTLHNALAILRASGLLHLRLPRHMASGGNFLLFRVITPRALQRYTAGLGAGRFHQTLRILLQIVAQGSLRDFLHFAFGRTTVLADHANLCILRASCVYHVLLELVLPGGRDLSIFSRAANRASILCLSIFAAGGRFYDFCQFPLVAGRDGNIVVIRRIRRIGILHDSVGRAVGGFDYRYGICSLILINRNGAAAGTNDSHTVRNLAGLDGASLHLNGSSRSGVLNQLRQCLRGTNIVLGAAGVRHGNGAAAIFHVILHAGGERAAGDGKAAVTSLGHVAQNRAAADHHRAFPRAIGQITTDSSAGNFNFTN